MAVVVIGRGNFIGRPLLGVVDVSIVADRECPRSDSTEPGVLTPLQDAQQQIRRWRRNERSHSYLAFAAAQALAPRRLPLPRLRR